MQKDSSIEVRMKRLEKQNKLLLVSVIGLFLLLVFTILPRTADKNPSVITANTLQLVDANGNVRAELANRENAPGLYIFDNDGNERLAATHSSDGTSIYLFDEVGTTRVGVAQFAHGGGGFALHGPDSKGAAVLYLKSEGSLRFFNKDGQVSNQVLSSDGNSQASEKQTDE